MKALWYAIVHKETGDLLRDTSGSYHILPNEQLLREQFGNWLEKYDEYEVKEIEQEVRQ